MKVIVEYDDQLQSSNLQDAQEKLSKLSPIEVSCNNWPDQFPETPKVSVRLLHNNKEIFVRFDVEEKYTMARVENDNGQVWTDSTCEFFISFDEKTYYNIEMTCIGKVLIGYRSNIEPQLGSTDSIKRLPSLGTEPFAERIGDNKWSLTYSVPIIAFWKHNLTELHGVKARGNFYKCGDNLTKPHFLSWSPIKYPTPNFHLPEFFGEISFE